MMGSQGFPELQEMNPLRVVSPCHGVMINQGKKMSLPTCHDLSRNVVVLDPA